MANGFTDEEKGRLLEWQEQQTDMQKQQMKKLDEVHECIEKFIEQEYKPLTNRVDKNSRFRKGTVWLVTGIGGFLSWVAVQSGKAAYWIKIIFKSFSQ